MSKSDEQDRIAESKCDLWGQIWSIMDIWPLAAILDFAINEKFLSRLVLRVKYYVHAKFCPNLMNQIQMPSGNVIYGVKFGRFLTFDLRQTSLILH